jgi:WD40 repeat protein
VAYSADGKTLAGGGGEQVASGAGTVEVARAWVWDAGSGKTRRTLDDLNTYLRSIAVSADGTRLATGCTGVPQTDGRQTWVPSEVRLWDTATGRELWAAHGAPGDCGGLAFSPDGAAVVCCDGGGVRVLSAATGEVTKVLMATSVR